MKVIKNERVIPIDVDETLVHHTAVEGGAEITVRDPYADRWIKVWANMPMLTILREEYSRGSFIIVWSKGGFSWAEAVIKTLHFEEYVDIIMSKPYVYFDDKDVDEWLKDRVWIHPNTVYKQTT